MNRCYIFLLALVYLASCKKQSASNLPVFQPQPRMNYIELTGKETKFNQPQHIDVDNDGNRDFSFVANHIGDPLLKREIIEFAATSAVDRLLLVDASEATPVLQTGDAISTHPKPGYHWFEIASTPLLQKIIQEQKPPYWIGNWNNAVHKYMAFQLRKNGLLYNGWLELSVDITGEKLILHRAAVCIEPHRNVKAGY